ncbi:MAG TPA: outer membrane protein assembly factor BamD [Gemmatimonadaceae bacterium]
MKLRSFLVVAILTAAGCKPGFNAGAYPNSDALFEAGLKEFNARRWENATRAFERLTTELSPRDPKIATAYYYLARAQDKRGDHLLAAKSFSRIYELLPQDTLADNGLFESGVQYFKMWRKPVLDAEYGQDAITQFQTLQSVYPDSPMSERAEEQLKKLDQWFAIKDYETGYHYLKRKAYDSAIIYFKDVIRLHPNAEKTRDAYLRLYQAYKAINYKEDMRDTCDAMRKAYPTDREVISTCGPAPATQPSQ